MCITGKWLREFLVASMIMFFGLPVMAGSLEKSMMLGASVGVNDFFDENNFGFWFTRIDSDTEIERSFSLTNQSVSGVVSAFGSYTNVLTGLGVGVEIQWNKIEFSVPDDDALRDTFNTDMVSFFLNFNWRAVASPRHNTDYDIGFVLSVGVGLVSFYSAEGEINFSVTGSPDYSVTSVYSGYCGSAVAAKAQVGVEFLLQNDFVISIGGGILGTTTANGNLVGGATEVVTTAGGPVFEQSMYIYVPELLAAYGVLTLGYAFNLS